MGRIPATGKTLSGLLLLFRPIEDWDRANPNVEWPLRKAPPLLYARLNSHAEGARHGDAGIASRVPSSCTHSNYITADRVLLRSNLMLALCYAGNFGSVKHSEEYSSLFSAVFAKRQKALQPGASGLDFEKTWESRRTRSPQAEGN
jgi:hypothetical protein